MQAAGRGPIKEASSRRRSRSYSSLLKAYTLLRGLLATTIFGSHSFFSG